MGYLESAEKSADIKILANDTPLSTIFANFSPRQARQQCDKLNLRYRAC